MRRILVTAENFAFGPIGKLLTVTDKLKDLGYHITFIGFGTAYQLAKKSRIDQSIEINTDGDNFEKEATPYFQEADFILTCMDRSTILLAQKMNKPHIWLDILFWWWDDLPEFVLQSDCFIKQNTLSDKRNILRLGPKVKNLHSVGPIIDVSPLNKTEKKDQAIVTYGGMEAAGWYTVGKDSNYPFTITKMLLKLENLLSFNKIIITGNKRIIDQLASQFKHEKFEFSTLVHEDFIKELASSKLALLTPGLEAPIEAFAYSIPAIFLPPSNSSQYVQLDEFIENNAGNMNLHFKNYYPELHLAGRDLRQIMSEFLEQLKVFEADTATQEKMVAELNQMISDVTALEQLQHDQNKYFQSMGENGLDRTISIIEKFASQV